MYQFMRFISLVSLSFFLFSSVVNCKDASALFPERVLQQHPRLLFSKQEEQRVQALAGREPLLDSLRAGLMKEAERLLVVPLQEDPRTKVKQTKDILPVSREQVYRMQRRQKRNWCMSVIIRIGTLLII